MPGCLAAAGRGSLQDAVTSSNLQQLLRSSVSCLGQLGAFVWADSWLGKVGHCCCRCWEEPTLSAGQLRCSAACRNEHRGGLESLMKVSFVCRTMEVPQSMVPSVHRGNSPWHFRTDWHFRAFQDTALQLWGCRDAWDLSWDLGQLLSFSSGDVEDFCCQIKELQEEVSRLCSIRQDEKKVDWIFSDILQVREPGLYWRTMQPMFVELGNGDCHDDDEGWKSVTCGSRQMALALLTDLQLQHKSVPW